jgi:heat-inducible transcriptional repressor
MLDERKASILRAVVEEYIETAQPVGSGHVANAPGVAVSSATVRNDMAVLEQEGYLHQPHTSAGRVPTDKGYRFFVDALTQPSLDQSSAQQVRSFFNRAHGEIESMLQDTTRLLSTLTNTAAVVVGPPHQDAATVRSVQLVGLAPNLALFVAVLSNGSVEKRSVDLPVEATEDQLARASAVLAQRLVGHKAADAAAVGQPSGSPEVDAVLVGVAAALVAPSQPDDTPVFVGGAARIAGGFEAIETVRPVLAILEQQLVVVSLLRDVLDRGQQVAIGTETGMEPLAECSLVVAPYVVDGEPAGTIGVLGPTRMDYPQALAAVAVVSKRLGRRLSEG